MNRTLKSLKPPGKANTDADVEQACATPSAYAVDALLARYATVRGRRLVQRNPRCPFDPLPPVAERVVNRSQG